MSTERSTESEAIVRFVAVEKTYDGVTSVVKNFDLAIHRGEFLTLLGPSGSGKTTVLMMLAGFAMPTAGDILLKGRSLAKVPPYRRNLGVVFQNYALFPHMSVYKNVAYPLVRRGLDRRQVSERVIAALRMVELEPFAGRRPAQLSGGQQQRVALARALVFEPDVVLMDEPLGALDRKLREQMQIEIKHLHDRLGMTVVYVTHDQAEALTMSDRVAVLHDGAIQQVDSPRDVYERPVNSFVANFIGESNNLRGTIVGIHAGACVVSLDGGSLVTAKLGAEATTRARVTVSVRPERVSLLRDKREQFNCLRGTVAEVIYLGDHFRARVAIDGAEPIAAQIPLIPDDREPRPGDQLYVGWAPEHCWAFEDARPGVT